MVDFGEKVEPIETEEGLVGYGAINARQLAEAYNILPSTKTPDGQTQLHFLCPNHVHTPPITYYNIQQKAVCIRCSVCKQLIMKIAVAP